MTPADRCRCDYGRYGYTPADIAPAQRCGCGHTWAAHATHRWHSCSVCVWCDEYRLPPAARGAMNRPVGADHSRRTPTGLTRP